MNKIESLAERLIEGMFTRLFKNGDNSASDTDANPGKKSAPALVPDTTKELRLATQPDVARQWWLQFGHRRIRLGQPVVSLGRAADNDIVLNDPELPPYYAQLRWRDGHYHLQLLPSSAADQTPLTPGDKIVMGRIKMSIVVHDQ